MIDQTIYFTHIPKTAGTSIRKGIFEPNVPASKRRTPNGLWSLLEDRTPFRYMGGHIPYGVHKFFPASPSLYFTILRDPIERAISHYYNILHPRGDKDVPDYPDYEVARTHSLIDFYSLPRFQNVQARMIGGIAATRIGRFVDLNKTAWLGKIILWLALRNLRTAYAEIGLTERFEETARRFADRLNCTYEPSENKSKVVPNRPRSSDLSPTERNALRQLNRLDVDLYDAAHTLFVQKQA